MVAISIQQSSISSLLNEAEIRAAKRCPTYDKDNAHWKRVDNLIEEQDRILVKLLNFDKEEKDLKGKNGVLVSDFLNLESPTKKACIDLSDGNHDSDSSMVQEIETELNTSKRVS